MPKRSPDFSSFGPVGPDDPVAPAAPSAPSGPTGPVGPSGPDGPEAPVGPSISDNLLMQPRTPWHLGPVHPAGPVCPEISEGTGSPVLEKQLVIKAVALGFFATSFTAGVTTLASTFFEVHHANIYKKYTRLVFKSPLLSLTQALVPSLLGLNS